MVDEFAVKAVAKQRLLSKSTKRSFFTYKEWENQEEQSLMGVKRKKVVKMDLKGCGRTGSQMSNSNQTTNLINSIIVGSQARQRRKMSSDPIELLSVSTPLH